MQKPIKMKWKKNLAVFAVFGLLILATLAMSGCTEEDKSKVVVTGSTTVKPVASRAASEFNSKHDDITVEVSGGGSGHGLAALGKGEADIGMASREVKQSEKDEYSNCDYTDHEIAKDGVAIIVSKNIYDSGVEELKSQQVVDIYTDKINNWKEVGGPDKNIFVVERQEGSGTRETFMDNLGLDSVNSDSAKPENAQVKSSVKSSDNAIGYVGLGYVGSKTPSVKLDGIEAKESTIKSGDYPISRSLHMYTDGEAEGNVKKFIEFVMSSEGQQIVADEDFIPVSGNSDDDQLSGTLTITGSTTVKPIAAAAASSFMDKHSKVTVEVTGGGSGHGIAALGKGEADIGDASREIKQSEKEQYPDTDYYDNQIAKDGVAIIVSKDIHDAGVKDLTTQQIHDIYTKNITTWDEVGGPSKPIQVVERQEGSGTRETFMDAIGLESTNADVAKPENAQVKSSVKSSNNAIGYVGLGYVGDKTPAIKLNGVKPTEENIVNGDYKISRSLHMYTDGEPTGLTKAFIDFVMSSEGQQIVADEGFIPINS